MERTCISCKHRTEQGKCDLVNIDMYEYRHISPSDGGCGLPALKWEPLYEFREELAESMAETWR